MNKNRKLPQMTKKHLRYMRKKGLIFLFFTLICIFPNTTRITNYDNSMNLEHIGHIPISMIYTEGIIPNPNTPNSVVRYDVHTRSVSLDSAEIISSPNSEIKPFIGLGTHLPPISSEMSSSLRSSYVFPPDNRSLVSPTTIFPYSSICKILVTAANGSRYLGTGAIIDDFHVLTCAHIVYIHSAGGWISDMKVIPGADGDYEPFSHAYATNFRTYTWWVDYAMYMHDLAVITLDRKIGTLTGWMGMRTTDVPGLVPWYTGLVHTAGYPGDLGGQFMYYTNESGDRSDSFNHWYWCDTAGGQSGSPVWMEDTGEQYILTVHTGGFSNGASANIGTRIDSYKFTNITTWLAEDSLSPPQDKPDFQVSLSQDYGLTDITTNETIVKLVSNVTNHGLNQSSNIRVNFFLSNDNTITEEDYLLGNGTIVNLDAFQSNHSEWNGKIPVDVENGLYYFGAIVDPQNDVDEYIESNNVDYVNQLVNITSVVNGTDPDPEPEPGPEEDQKTFIEKILDSPLLIGISIGGITIIVSIPIGISVLLHKKKSRKKNVP